MGFILPTDLRHAIPPDPNVAAGPKYVVNTVNTAIRISDKAGNILSTQELSSFFALLGDVHGLSESAGVLR